MHESSIGLLADMQNYGLSMRRECRERFPPWHVRDTRAVMHDGIAN